MIKFLNQTKVAQDIEEILHANGDLNIIEAVSVYCEENDIELRSIKKLLNKTILDRIEEDARKLHLLKETKSVSPPLL